MAIGLGQDKNSVNARCGTAANMLIEAFRQIAIVKGWMDTKSVADLEGLGYTTGEANTIKSAYTDLDKIRQVFEGTATQATTYDFRTFAKLLVGVN